MNDITSKVYDTENILIRQLYYTSDYGLWQIRVKAPDSDKCVRNTFSAPAFLSISPDSNIQNARSIMLSTLSDNAVGIVRTAIWNPVKMCEKLDAHFD